jgi:hypothetical protein
MFCQKNSWRKDIETNEILKEGCVNLQKTL